MGGVAARARAPAARTDGRSEERREARRPARGRAARVGRRAGVAGRRARQRAGREPRPPARRSTIKTDLYTAEVDTVGGVITLVALDKHRDAARHRQALSRAAAERRAHLRRAGRPDRRRHAEPSDDLSGAARPARARARHRHGRPQARGDRREWRQGRADADVPSRQLRDRRRVRRHQRGHGAPIDARGVLPADARHQAGGDAELDGAGGVRRAGRLQRDRQVQEGRIRRDRQGSGRSLAQVAVHEERRQRLGRHDRALLRRRVAAARGTKLAAAVLHDQARQRPLHGGRPLRRRVDRARRHRRSQVAALRRTAGPGGAREARHRPRPRRRLRHLHDHRGAAVRAAQVAARHHRQLGLGDHRDDDHHQGRVLSAEPRERALDGQDEGRRAEDEGAAGAVRERQAAAPGQDDGALPAGEDQPAGRLPADRRADPGVHRALLGAAVGGRAAPRAVDRLDPRSLGARSVLHPAGRLRDHRVPAGASCRRRRSPIRCRRA